MRLPGRLCATTLGDLLGSLYRERATGTLELVELDGSATGRVHRVHLDGGLVGSVDSRLPGLRLGEILRSEGFIAEEALRRLARRLDDGRRIGELLVEDRVATPGLIEAALRFQLRRRLDALFSLRDASVRFHVARRRPGDGALPLSPHEFLHGRARARDREPEWTESSCAGRSPGGTTVRAQRGAPEGRSEPSVRQPAQRSGDARAGAHTPQRHDPVRARALDVLGLGPGAGSSDVQRAFRSLARQHHPDRFPGANPRQREALMRRFAELSEAYHLLVG